MTHFPKPIVNISVFQNATFKMFAQLTDSVNNLPINITSWSFSGSIRQNYEDQDPPVLIFSTSVNYSQSIVGIFLTPTQTSVLKDPGYVYDIIATNYAVEPDEVYRILQGKVFVSPGVTDAPPTV